MSIATMPAGNQHDEKRAAVVARYANTNTPVIIRTRPPQHHRVILGTELLFFRVFVDELYQKDAYGIPSPIANGGADKDRAEHRDEIETWKSVTEEKSSQCWGFAEPIQILHLECNVSCYDVAENADS